MARETIKCPNCDCKVLLSDVEKEDAHIDLYLQIVLHICTLV